MDWIVRNALSRDVEREHLNKILSEIRSKIDSGGETSSTYVSKQPVSIVRPSGGAGGSSSSNTPSNITVTLEGDVMGRGSGTSSVVIQTRLKNTYLEDAPNDGLPYWRRSAEWSVIPARLEGLASNSNEMDGSGFAAWDDDDGGYAIRTIDGDEEWTTSINNDGADGNPTIVLTEDAKQGYSRIIATASAIVHGLRAVVIDAGQVRHPSIADVNDAVLIAGVARTSAVIGEDVNIQTDGVVKEQSWVWNEGPVYVDDEGHLTQTAPPSGYVVSIGRAISTNEIDINISLALIRS